jgi:transcriptional regulator with AAA-type ATPase domain
VRFGGSAVTGSATAGSDAALVGREEELARLRELVASPYAESRALLLLGESGMGKTLLVARAVQAARAAGMRVLAAAGRESDRTLRSPGCISCSGRC